jgi:hypothetical protein
MTRAPKFACGGRGCAGQAERAFRLRHGPAADDLWKAGDASQSWHGVSLPTSGQPLSGRTLWEADRFLAQHGYVEGPPTVEPRPGKWQLDEVKAPPEPK